MHSELHYNCYAKTPVHIYSLSVVRSYPGALYVWLTCDGEVAEDVDIMLGDAPRLALLGEELDETRERRNGDILIDVNIIQV